MRPQFSNTPPSKICEIPSTWISFLKTPMWKILVVLHTIRDYQKSRISNIFVTSFRDSHFAKTSILIAFEPYGRFQLRVIETSSFFDFAAQCLRDLHSEQRQIDQITTHQVSNSNFGISPFQYPVSLSFRIHMISNLKNPRIQLGNTMHLPCCFS